MKPGVNIIIEEQQDRFNKFTLLKNCDIRYENPLKIPKQGDDITNGREYTEREHGATIS